MPALAGLAVEAAVVAMVALGMIGRKLRQLIVGEAIKESGGGGLNRLQRLEVGAGQRNPVGEPLCRRLLCLSFTGGCADRID